MVGQDMQIGHRIRHARPIPQADAQRLLNPDLRRPRLLETKLDSETTPETPRARQSSPTTMHSSRRRSERFAMRRRGGHGHRRERHPDKHAFASRSDTRVHCDGLSKRHTTNGRRDWIPYPLLRPTVGATYSSSSQSIGQRGTGYDYAGCASTRSPRDDGLIRRDGESDGLKHNG
jgi:hypothetical protein